MPVLNEDPNRLLVTPVVLEGGQQPQNGNVDDGTPRNILGQIQNVMPNLHINPNDGNDGNDDEEEDNQGQNTGMLFSAVVRFHYTGLLKLDMLFRAKKEVSNGFQ